MNDQKRKHLVLDHNQVTKHTKNARKHTPCVFYFFCKKVLAIPQKCGIMIIQKANRNKTATKQEEHRMTYTVEMNINGTWKTWATYDQESRGISAKDRAEMGLKIARNYGECRIVEKEGK